MADWAARLRKPSARPVAGGGLRFAFYWRVSTEDHQDPVTSRTWQLERALATIFGEGRIVVEFFDVGQSRSTSWQRRPGAAALLAALADPARGFDAVVIGSHERAFYGNQFSLIAPLFHLHGVPLWMPELAGEVDPSIGSVEELLTLLGIIAKREIIRARQRVTHAMTVQVRDQGRWQGGRVPYGLQLVDAGPHPNCADARRGRRLLRLDADPDTAPTVRWMFAARLAGASLSLITRALNEQQIPCPSGEDPEANPHRSGREWTLGTVREVLSNPVYTGRMVWGRSRADYELVDPDNTGLGHRRTRHRPDPDQWVISTEVTHAALVSEADFITVQNMRADRADARHDYRLKACCAAGSVTARSKDTGSIVCLATAAATDTPAPRTRPLLGRRTPTYAKTASWPSCRCFTTCSPPPNWPRSSPAHLPAPPAPSHRVLRR
ncbi:site-specific DNA recombinase [Catenulispora sp. MAP5-51]